MGLFIDSSEPKEIKDLYAWGVLSGVTTNPLIIAREAPDADLGERIREILAVSTGDVSVELTPRPRAKCSKSRSITTRGISSGSRSKCHLARRGYECFINSSSAASRPT